MEGDRSWAAPTEYVVVGRKWKYAPPPSVMYEAVVDDMEQWLSLLTGEMTLNRQGLAGGILTFKCQAILKP
jgi:hypothetical protein